MTSITFDQTLPSEDPGRVPASGRVEITRGQRSVSGDTTLLPGKVGEMLVSGYATIENVTPTAVNEFVLIEYKTKYPYARTVQVPNTTTVADTDLVDVALSSLEPSVSSIPAWDAAVAAVGVAVTSAEAAQTAASGSATAAAASATAAQEVVDGMIVDASLSSYDLVLERQDGTTVNVGNVRGEAGPGGDSAYAVAVAGGFSGTSAEWLASLDGADGSPGAAGFSVVPWSKFGDLSVATSIPLYNDSGRAMTIVSVRATVGTAPTGDSVIVDVKKDATTIFTTTANRPTITAGTKTATGVPDVTTWESDSYLTVSIDNIGSTVPGSNLTVTVVTQ